MNEKQLELAEAIATSIIEAGINKSRNRQVKPLGFDGYCECGEDIPQARITAGYYNCVPCQELIERGYLATRG